MYRVVWRWHFYAGMIIAPSLIAVAATVAIYIFKFKDELEAMVYPGAPTSQPTAERASYEKQMATVRATEPAAHEFILSQVFTNPKRATTMGFRGSAQYAYVDPYRGHYLGTIEQDGFFDVVLSGKLRDLRAHRRGHVQMNAL